jgi:ubiquinone/menaquinone biosynthesis C-methylase UbiE
MKEETNLQKTWDEMSPYYQRKYGNSLMFYEKTIHLKFFGNLKGKKLLDLGCGGGQTSIFFAEQGAIVTGVDFSKKQIDFAKDLAKKKRMGKVSFQQGNMEDLSVFKDCSFDLVNSSHTIHYVKNLQKCFNEVFRVLKPKGKFVFSVSHPFNHIVETENNRLVVKRSYFRKGKYKWNWDYPEEGLEYPTFLFIRKVDDYFVALKQSGFVVEDLLEPKTDLDKNSPWYSDGEPKEEMIPGALIFGARKPQKKGH